MASNFIRALALGWKNLAAYPPGHPVLTTSLEQLHRQLHDLRGPAPDVVFGIAADGLLWSGEKIDTPQAQKFAQALYTRGVAVLRFDGATDARDLETFLRLLGVGAQESKRPIWEELIANDVTRIVLQPVDYSGVQVTDSLAAPEPKNEPVASLWDEILRALMAGNQMSARDAPSHQVNSMDQLSALLNRYVESAGIEATFDPNVTFGLQVVRVPETADAVTKRVAEAIGGYVGNSSGLRRQFALGQIAQLLRTLPEALRTAVIRSVLRVLAADESAGALLREFALPLTRDEVLDGLRALANSSKLSSHAAMLLQSLAAVAPRSAAQTQLPADVVAELAELFGEEDVDRFNPPDHAALLEDIAIEIPRVSDDVDASPDRLGDRVASIAEEAINRHLAETALDLLAKHGARRSSDALLARVEAAFRTFLDHGEFSEGINLVERLREIAAAAESVELQSAVRASLARLATPDAVRSLITGLQHAPPETTALIQKLIEAMGTVAAQNLLVALAEESNRSRRRRLFDFTCSLGAAIVPVATSFLTDERWYVVRNMIVLLRTVGDRTSLPGIRRCAQHPDLRVRLEAIKTLLAFEPAVPTALLDEAINDPDPKLAEAAIALVASYGIREGVGPLLKILDGNDLLGRRRGIRLKAIKALGELAEPSALPRMQRFFPDPFLPWPGKDERLAVYESLAGYPEEPRKRFVAIGLQSRDPRIRAACKKLAPEGVDAWND